MFEYYKKVRVDRERRLDALKALGNSRLPWTYDLFFNELFDNNTQILSSDFFYVFEDIGKNPSGRYQAWYKLRDKFVEIQAKYVIYFDHDY
jgi:hypothetical protein